MGAASSMSGTPRSPEDMQPRQAVERFLRKRQTDATDRTLRSYTARLEIFADWCEERGIGRLGDLTAFDVDEFDIERRNSELAPATIKSHLTTLRVFLSYCEDIGGVEEDLPESVDVPTLTKQEESSDERLAEEDAMNALEFLRGSPKYEGTVMHAFLEVAWHSGARMGGIRGLDIGDYHAEEQYLEFNHRPSTDTPLKNKQDGERLVGISDKVCRALDIYVARERSEKRDEHGRDPLFCARQGRPSFSSLRACRTRRRNRVSGWSVPTGSDVRRVSGRSGITRRNARVRGLLIASGRGASPGSSTAGWILRWSPSA